MTFLLLLMFKPPPQQHQVDLEQVNKKGKIITNNVKSHPSYDISA